MSVPNESTTQDFTSSSTFYLTPFQGARMTTIHQTCTSDSSKTLRVGKSMHRLRLQQQLEGQLI